MNQLGLDPSTTGHLVEMKRQRYMNWKPPAYPPSKNEALKTAIFHLEHMAAWIGKQRAGYSFESLSEDMPGIRGALNAPINNPSRALRVATITFLWLASLAMFFVILTVAFIWLRGLGKI